jgi:hypothetical protein
MAYPSQTVVLRGKTMYAKILGAPVLNYSKDGLEWKTDLVINKNTVKELKAYGIQDRVKQKDEFADGEPYLSFKSSELRKDGSKNSPIEVVDITGKPWNHDVLIGNGSDVDVKFAVVDYGVGKKRGVYIRSVRVLKLVPYNKDNFAPIAEDDPFFNLIVEAQEMFDVGSNSPDEDLDDSLDDVV